MGKYRKQLPQLSGEIFLTDGGTETYLMYKRGLELPHFSAFHLLDDPKGYEEVRQYFTNYAVVAKKYRKGLILCSINYRASSDWGTLLGYSKSGLASINHKAIGMLREVADEFESDSSKMVISGGIGPRDDAYELNRKMSAEEAEQYHAEQIQTLGDADVDMVTGLTLNNASEAIGIARAAKSAEIPVVISFTVETDGKLSSGQTLKDAISLVDAETDNAPAYYMLNCAHPLDYESALEDAPWMKRLRGIRPNASSKSHGELCELGRLDEGDPVELGQQIGELSRRFGHINVFGGCCGTDHVHVEEICKRVLAVN
jgi:S-methylmethionine-dependent homocysteine/selenocysteine methylase